ncbi:MAG: TolC family protein [Proteobacteria bacterium]|nr:TolC family protein [Pseudomonadota bacterium]
MKNWKYFSIILFILILSFQTARAETTTVPPLLDLDTALRIAREHQPQLVQAAAESDAAQARVGTSFSPLLPQVVGSAGYLLGTGNNPGTGGTQSWNTSDSWNFKLSANQLIYDFGQSFNQWRAARANAGAQRESENTTLLQILLNVRTIFFDARASKALMKVADETQKNQERHLAQIQGFVEIGSRPEIDLAQVRSDLANARLSMINAENGYETAKARLNQAMGVEAATNYEVADETLPPVEQEEQSTEILLEEALRARPEFAVLSDQIRAREMILGSIQGGYWPSLNLSAGVTAGGDELNQMSRNWSGGVTLNWPLFQGELTRAQAAEARANLRSLKSQSDTLRQQVRLDVEQARLAIRAAKAAIAAADDAVVNARKRLDLAEARYQTGVGNMIELGDAQVALSNMEAQKVQADYNLASARARLLQALGRQ